MRIRGVALVVALVSVALLAGGCGSSGDGTDASATVKKATPQQAAKRPEPTPTLQTGPAPNQLEKHDLIVGTGPKAKPGEEVTVQYLGVLYKGGEKFDASWDRGEPFSFPLGEGLVIPGWEEGIAGMRVGGRRELIVPPAQGYGSQAAGTIPPNSTLVFIVDLLGVK